MTFDAFADFRMKGHVAIVTGGAQNIGEAIARTFAGAGAKVVIADLNGAKAAETATRISGETGSEVMGLGCDVTGRSGRPQDVANAFLWLASPAGGWVSGQTFQVAGGGARVRLIPD